MSATERPRPDRALGPAEAHALARDVAAQGNHTQLRAIVPHAEMLATLARPPGDRIDLGEVLREYEARRNAIPALARLDAEVAAARADEALAMQVAERARLAHWLARAALTVGSTLVAIGEAQSVIAHLAKLDEPFDEKHRENCGSVVDERLQEVEEMINEPVVQVCPPELTQALLEIREEAIRYSRWAEAAERELFASWSAAWLASPLHQRAERVFAPGSSTQLFGAMYGEIYGDESRREADAALARIRMTISLWADPVPDWKYFYSTRMTQLADMILSTRAARERAVTLAENPLRSIAFSRSSGKGLS